MAADDATNADVNASLKKLSDGFGSLAGTFIAGKASIADTLGAFPGVGTQLKAVSGFLEENVQMYRNLTKVGGGAAGDITVLMQQARGAGLGLKEFQDISVANADVFAGLGGTVSEGSKLFYKQLSELRVSDLGKDLRRLGLEYEDMAEAQAFISRMDAMSLRRDQISDATRNQRTAEFAKSMDALSKLTGKQKDEIQKELDARMREGKVRAYMMGLGEEEAALVRKQLAEADAAGFGDLARDILVNGFPTEETRAQAGIMGDTTSSLLQFKSMIDGGVDASNKADADLMIAKTQGVALQENLNNRNLAMLAGVTSMGDVAGKSLEGMSQGYMTQLSEINKQQELLGRSLTAEELLVIQKEARAKAEKEQQDQTKDEGGTEGQQLTRNLIAAQDSLVDYQSKIQTEATEKLYNGLLTPAAKEFADFLGSPYTGDTNENFAALQDSINLALGNVEIGNQRDNTQVIDDLQSAITEIGATNPGGVAELMAKLAEIREMTGEDQKNAIKELALEVNTQAPEGSRVDLDSIIDGSALETAYFSVSDAVIFKGLSNNSEGTVGSTGSILADFGKETIAALHGKEAVLNEKQLTNLVNGVYTIGSESLIKAVGPKLDGMLNNNMSSSESLIQSVGPKLEGMLNNMSSSLSSSIGSTSGATSSGAPALPEGLMEQLQGMQGPMKETLEQLKGPMESMAGNMMKQVNLSGKQLRTSKMNPGNLFAGIKL